MGPHAQLVIIARLRKGFDPVAHAQGVELTLGDNLPGGRYMPPIDTDASHEPAEPWMTSLFKTATLLFAALFLGSCGGGGSSPPEASLSPATCELSMFYASGSINGTGYEIRSILTESVPRQFNPCLLKTIQSASVSLCLDHPQIAELSAQLRLPNNSSVVLNLQTAQPGAACLNTGVLYSIPLRATELPLANSGNLNWTVGVTDTDQVSTTRTGYLVGWSMKIEGLQ